MKLEISIFVLTQDRIPVSQSNPSQDSDQTKVWSSCFHCARFLFSPEETTFTHLHHLWSQSNPSQASAQTKVWSSCFHCAIHPVRQKIPMMCNPSPAKVKRSVRRITRFLEQKSNNKSFGNKPTLSIKVLPQSNFYPLQPKTLAISRLQQISIPACPRNLSYRKFPTTEIVPGIQNDDDYLFSSYINGGSHFCLQLLLWRLFFQISWFHTFSYTKWTQTRNVPPIEEQTPFWARIWRLELETSTY